MKTCVVFKIVSVSLQRIDFFVVRPTRIPQPLLDNRIDVLSPFRIKKRNLFDLNKSYASSLA